MASMKGFYAVYAALLLMVSLAFTYFEIYSKDQRILKAKVTRAHELVKKQDCGKAFNLLTQRDQPAMDDHYADKDKRSVKALRTSLCKALNQSSNLKEELPRFRRQKDADHQESLYKVNLPNVSKDGPQTLSFERIKGELVLTQVE